MSRKSRKSSQHFARSARVRKLRRSWAQRFVILGGALSAMALATSAAGLSYLYRKVERIPRIELSRELDQVEAPGGPQNYLVVGIDSAARTAADDPIRDGRDATNLTDTIMVVRVDPSSQQVAILSLPRDLWVPYPTGGNGKINGLYAQGGMRPDLLIQTINSYLGVPIHHYVQVDFAGFYDLVNAIDGVPVYFPAAARDENSGLWVTETGCVTLDAEQAVGFVRSRHYEELVQGDGSHDRDWKPDNQNDFGRIKRQQDFIRRALERAVSKGARNPGTLDRLLDVALRSVTIDDELTPGAIFDLAKKFRDFDPNSLQNQTLPVVGDTGPGGASIQRLVQGQAEPVLAQFRDAPVGSDPPPDPGGGSGTGDGAVTTATPDTVRLTVLNGTGVSGQASEAGDALSGVGFGIVDRRDAQGADAGQPRTVIRYPAGLYAQADLIRRYLTADADLIEVPAGTGDQLTIGIELITGANWDGVLSDPRPPATAPSTTSTTTTSTAGGSTGSTSPPDTSGGSVDPTTTTTLPPAC
ncbi:MAG TPA: LCP family protein [Acidimicrobiales bacterium]